MEPLAGLFLGRGDLSSPAMPTFACWAKGRTQYIGILSRFTGC